MLKKTVALACAGLFIATAGGWAQNVGDGLDPEPDQSTTRVATRGANFLEIPVGARASALGGSGSALIRGVESMAWNVAGMAEIESFAVGWSYSELFAEADITHQFAGVVLPITSGSAIGASVIILNSGDITRTTESFPEGGDPTFGDLFDWSSFAGSFGYAQAITDRLSVGGALKFVSEGIQEAKANWVGADIGALFRTGLFGVTIGATVQNIGGEARFSGSGIERTLAAGQDAFDTGDNVSIQFDTRELLLPTMFRFSAVFDVTGTPDAWLPEVNLDHNVKAIADFADGIDTALEPGLGFEYSYKDFVFGRVGKRWVNEDRADFREFSDGLAFGGGIKLPVLGRYLALDYAYTDMGILEDIQTFSIQLGP